MARKKSPTLTEAELRLMEVLWDRGPSSVADVMEALPEPPRIAYNTALTVLRILERKGYATREKEGRAHIYRAVVDRGAVRRGALRYILNRFFDDSPELLVLNVIEGEELSAEELHRLRTLIGEAGEGND